MHSHDDRMRHALRLAARQIGHTAENPAVGCVIVKDEQIIGIGATANGGRPHAETTALDMAREQASGATLYVTLEPCAHHGQTPPCVDAIIKAGIATVVIACADPDPRTSGQSITKLRDAGIDIITGICEAEARAQHAGFFTRLTKQRPFVTLKLATSADGYIAIASGESQWITGDAARTYGHRLRAQHDAILTGIGTVLADNPSLTCRINGLEQHSPIRIVADTQLRLPLDSTLAQTANTHPVWLLHDEALTGSDQAKQLADQGITLIPCPTTNNHIDIQQALPLLAKRGINRLMVEAGSTLSTAFLTANLVDQLVWFRAPLLIGAAGKPAIGHLPNTALTNLPRMKHAERLNLGDDLCDIYDLTTDH